MSLYRSLGLSNLLQDVPGGHPVKDVGNILHLAVKIRADRAHIAFQMDAQDYFASICVLFNLHFDSQMRHALLTS
ncbi:MAG: hypothetical protein AAGK00_03275 [Pseudomonadota bacterium]